MLTDLKQKLGQLFFVGFEGYSLTKEKRDFLQTIQPGGIVFFECNIKNKKQVKTLIKDINNCLEIKPFIAIDQEGGSVERLRNICTSIPSPWGLAKTGLKELLSGHEIIAQELSELGFNMNFYPVLDINCNLANPIINTRALSNNPGTVSEYGKKIIQLYLKHNIIPVIKHFPGHGDLNIDSHVQLPRLNKSISKLNNFELIPFKKAIKEKAPVIMVGHIQVPALEADKRRPASLSKKIMSGLLRNKLYFKGLIMTDELNMKGVTRNYEIKKASFEAINSGADIILFNWLENISLNTFKYLHQNNKDLKSKINNSYKRIKLIKEKYVVKPRRELKTISSKNHHRIAQELSQRTVHWIKRNLFFDYFKAKDLIQIIYPKCPKVKPYDIKNICKIIRLKKYTLIEYNSNPDLKNIEQILKRTKNTSNKLLITYNLANNNMQKRLINLLSEKHRNLVILSTGIDHEIELIPNIKNFISSYAPNYVSLLIGFKKAFI